jgi:hypothetical protein
MFPGERKIRHRMIGTPTMPTTQFTVHTSLSPSDVMAVLTDFGPDRSRWCGGGVRVLERQFTSVLRKAEAR